MQTLKHAHSVYWRIKAPHCRRRNCKLQQTRRQRTASGIACTAAQDEVLRSMSSNGQVSVMVVDGKQLVLDACRRHQTAPTASAALGRALLGTLLMGCFRGPGEKTQVTWRGNGLLSGMQAISDAHGQVKGKVGNPLADPPLRPDGKLNVGAAVGKGVLAVVRSDAAMEKPYTGMVEIQTGEVGDDLANYLLESEQTASALGVGVSIHKDGSIRAAGGFLVQVLPFAEEDTLQQLEANLQGLTSITDLLHAGMTPQSLTERLLNGLGPIDSSFSLHPRYGPCEKADLRHRMKRAVALLGKAEVEDILQKEGRIEVTCEFCRDSYRFDPDEVMRAAA